MGAPHVAKAQTPVLGRLGTGAAVYIMRVVAEDLVAMVKVVGKRFSAPSRTCAAQASRCATAPLVPDLRGVPVCTCATIRVAGAEQQALAEEQRQLAAYLDDLLAKLKRDCPLVPPTVPAKGK